MTKSSRSSKATTGTKKKQCEYFFFDGMHLLLYLLLRLSSSMVGFNGNSPSGIVCSSVCINNATDVASLLTVVLTAIPPVAVEEAASWTESNYQACVICNNIIDLSIVHLIKIDDVFTLVLLFFSDT
jgi:hypothetical protein